MGVSGIPQPVVALFEEYALDLRRRGFERYSARAILHQIRWHYHIDRGDREFTCNNNWTPRLARWFLAEHPEMNGFFELRASPSRHSLEDYDGPYEGSK